MILGKINRESPENVYRYILNKEGATITNGLPVSLVHASTDGVKGVIANAAADYTGFQGVAIGDIANNDYGKIQMSGFVNSVLISHIGSSVTINAGDPLVPAPSGFFSGAPSYAAGGLKYGFVSNGPTVIQLSNGSGYASMLIKSLI